MEEREKIKQQHYRTLYEYERNGLKQDWKWMILEKELWSGETVVNPTEEQ